MNSTRTTHSIRRRSTASALVIVGALVAAGFGVDAASDTTTPDTTPAGTTPVTSEPAVTPEDALIVIRDSDEFLERSATCVYRRGEMIVDTTGNADWESDLTNADVNFERLGGLGDSERLAGLELILIDGDDPFDVAQRLDGTVRASPNYLFAFAPAWKYAPDNTPELADAPTEEQLNDAPLTFDPVTVAVLDTGYADVADATATNVIQLPPPDVPLTDTTPTDEVSHGVAAGHGTFIVNELGQLLPEATIVVGSTGQRHDHDDLLDVDSYFGRSVTPGGKPAVVRDDSSVTASLAALADAADELELDYDYLNLSFGTYGCTGHPAFAESEEEPPAYMTPVGILTVLERWAGEEADEEAAAAGSAEEDPAMQVFAAAGNDGHDTSHHSEIFYPAGWAPSRDWLHSVGSDPRDDPTEGIVDYSNRGPWVEYQARGSDVVSLLPANTWDGAGWYVWSGTSFATPCALAAHAAGIALKPATTDRANAYTVPYTECRVNQTAAE